MSLNKPLKSLGLIVVLAFLFVSSSFAQVYVSSTGGDDPTGAGTIGSPYATIAKAISVAAAGNTIYVADGTYTAGNQGAAAVNINKDLTFVAYSRNGGTDVVFDATFQLNFNSDLITFGASGNKMIANKVLLTKGAISIATATFQIADGGTIERKAGAFNVAPTFAGNTNVTYTATASLASGFELPADLVGGTLTVNNAASSVLTVAKALSMAKLSVAAGNTLDMTAGNLTVVGDNTAAPATDDIINAGVIKLNANKLVFNTGTTGAVLEVINNSGKIISATAATVGSAVVEITGKYNVSYTGGGELPGLSILSTLEGTFTLASAVDVYGPLTISSPTVGAFTDGGQIINLKGNFLRNNNTLGNVAATGTLAFNGAANQSLDPGANLTLTNLTVDNAGKEITLVKSVELNGNLTITNGKFNVGDNNLFLIGNASTFTNAGEFYSGTGVGYLIINATAGAKTCALVGSGTFANIDIRNATTVTFTGAAGVTKVAQNLILRNGTITNPASSLQFNSHALQAIPTLKIYTAAGIVAAGGTAYTTFPGVTYNLEFVEEAGAAAAWATGGTDFLVESSINNLSVTSAATKAVNVTLPAQATTVKGILTIGNGNTLTIGAAMSLAGNSLTHSVAGTLTGALLTVDGYNVTINGDATVATTAANALPAVTVNNAGSQTFTLNSMKTIGAFTYTGGVANLNFHESFAGATGALVINAGTVTFAGAKGIVTTGTANLVDGTVNVNGDLRITGAVTQTAGNLVIADTKKLTLNHAYTHNGAGTITGAGWFVAGLLTANTPQSYTFTNALSVPNFELKTQANTDQIDLAGANNITVTNQFLATIGDLDLNGKPLNISGNTITVAKAADFSVTNTGGAAAGLINLTGTNPVLTTDANETLGNVTLNTDGTLTIKDDKETDADNITLNTISTAIFTQTKGNVALNGHNLEITNQLARTAGNITATLTNGTGGWLIWNSATAANFDQGVGFSVANLYAQQALTAENATTNHKWTVTNNLKFNAAINAGTDDYLQVSNLATITKQVAGVDFTNTIKFAGDVNLVYNIVPAPGPGQATIAPGKELVPDGATSKIVNNLTIGSVLTTLQLRATDIFTVKGTLKFGAANAILDATTNAAAKVTMGDGSTLEIMANGNLDEALTKAATAAKMNVVFNNTGALTTHINYFDKSVFNINDVTIKGGGTVTLHSAAAATDAPSTFTGTVTFTGAGNLEMNGVSRTVTGNVKQTAATAGFFVETLANDLSKSLVLAGSTNTTVELKQNIVLGTNAATKYVVEVKKDAGKTVTVSGGSLDFATNAQTIKLTSGALATGATDYVILKQDKNASNQPTQGFTRTTGVIVGNVKKFINYLNAIENTVVEYPLGTIEGKYRPATFFFKTAPQASFNLAVTHEAVKPGGKNNIPLMSGTKQITNYPSFFWYVKSDVALAPSYKYDAEFGAEGYTDYIKDAIQNVRLIRRDSGNVDNQWILQGADANYDNSTVAVDFPKVKVIDATGGVTVQGSKFTYSQMNKPPVVVKAATKGKAATALTIAKETITGLTVKKDAVNVTETDSLYVTYTVTDPDLGQTPTFTVVTKPEAATYDATTKKLTWITTNSDSGSHPVIFKANDGNVDTYDTLYVKVANKNRAPEFETKLADQLLFADQKFTFEYKGKDIDSDALTFTKVSGPDSLKVTTAGVLTWTPVKADEGKDFTVIVKLTDKFGLFVQDTAKLSVNKNIAPAFTKAVYETTVNVGSKFYADSTATITVVAKDANALDLKKLSFTFADPTLSPANATFTKTNDTTAVFVWTPKASTPSSIVLINVKVSDGELSSTTELRITVKNVTENENEIPTTFTLKQNYPNPFNPTTLVEYDLAKESNVKVVVYNVLGQLVTELVNEVQKAGTYKETFDAGNLSSGLYIIKIVAQPVDGSEAYVKTIKAALIK